MRSKSDVQNAVFPVFKTCYSTYTHYQLLTEVFRKNKFTLPCFILYIYTMKQTQNTMTPTDTKADFTKLSNLEKNKTTVKTETGREMTEIGKKAVELRKELISKYGQETMSLYIVGGLKAVINGYASRSHVGRLLNSKGNYGIEK